MFGLIAEIWIYLLIALLIGIATGWMVCTAPKA